MEIISDNSLIYYFRRKTGSSVRYEGEGEVVFAQLLEDHSSSFIYVADETSINIIMYLARKFNRDIDLVKESLGNFIKIIERIAKNESVT